MFFIHHPIFHPLCNVFGAVVSGALDFGLWTLNESSEAVRSLRYFCRCGGSGEYATRIPSIRFACFNQSLIVVMAVRNRLALERKSHRSGHIPCDLRQQSGGNDLGEKSCTNDNSRSSCNQDALAAIPCRSFIVVGL